MKKLIIFAIAAMAICSCGPRKTVTTVVDSVDSTAVMIVDSVAVVDSIN